MGRYFLNMVNKKGFIQEKAVMLINNAQYGSFLIIIKNS